MTSQNQLAIDIRNSVILECGEDYVGLWSIIWQFREIGREQNPLERKKKTMRLIKELLEEDLIKAASFSNEKQEFQTWNVPVNEILARIEREWDDLGREPDLWEIVWFTGTEKGNKEANRLLFEKQKN
ncbi:MAG: hypothetical protein AAGA60_07250 [Cyanobacteria bacterium P01_E01_bin.42]